MSTLELSQSKHEYTEPLNEKDYLKIQSYIFATYNYSANSPERTSDYEKLLEITDFNIFKDDKVARELVGLLKKTNDKQTFKLFECMANNPSFFKKNKNGINISEDVFNHHLSSINNHLHLRKASDLSKYIFKLGIDKHYEVNTDMKPYLGIQSTNYEPINEKVFFPFLSFFYFYPNYKLMGAWVLLEENKDSLILNGKALSSFSQLRAKLEEKSNTIMNWEEVEKKLIFIEKDLLELTLSYQEKEIPTARAKKNKI